MENEKEKEETAKSGYTEENESTRIYATVAFAIVILVVGVPLWWKTTQVYRMAIPHEEILEQASTQVSLWVNIVAVVIDESVGKSELQTAEDALNKDQEDFKLLIETYRWTVRHLEVEENVAFKKCKSIDELSSTLANIDPMGVGQTKVILLPRSSNLLSDEASLHVANHRHVFVRSGSAGVLTILREAEQLVKNMLVNSDNLQTAVASVMAPQLFKPDKTTMRTVRTTPSYELTFTLVNPQPSMVLAHWDVEAAVNKYLSPMLEKLETFAEFHIKSQVLYLTSLNVHPNHNKDKNIYCLTSEQLSHVINPVEAKLGSHISTDPSLNFLVYIPTRDQTPLQILEESGRESGTNAFLSPRWGGMMIYNVPNPRDDNSTSGSSSLPQVIEIDMRSVMSVFISQLRFLLGLNPLPINSSVKFSSLDKSCLMDWETDFLIRRRTLENIARASFSLHSLSQLLGQIRNIVINDQVGEYIYDALDSLERSREYLAVGENLGAFLKSKEAFILSEKAFFDPSMLAYLYFPDDQKYAIYVPLFVPVSFPMLCSLWYMFQLWRNSRKKGESAAKPD